MFQLKNLPFPPNALSVFYSLDAGTLKKEVHRGYNAQYIKLGPRAVWGLPLHKQMSVHPSHMPISRQTKYREEMALVFAKHII
jgi:hypothetical protein